MLKDVGSLRAAIAKEYLFKKYGFIKKNMIFVSYLKQLMILMETQL